MVTLWPLKRSSLAPYRIATAIAVLAAGISPVVNAEETALEPLKKLDPQGKKHASRSYVTIKGGATNGQSGSLRIGEMEELGYGLDEYNGGAVFGFEVGKSWKLKRFPFEVGLEFEGGFMSSELNGELNSAFGESIDMSMGGGTGGGGSAIPSLDGGVPLEVSTDMNVAFFMLNGTLTLDLWRYRARLGRVLTRFRPYVGGGIGGGQIWFRNTELTLNDPTATATVDPFATDEFVFVYQWFGGAEYMVNDKISVFGEFRTLVFDDFSEVIDLETENWSLGVRINYDKPQPEP